MSDPRHDAATRMLGHALVLNDAETWLELSGVLAARLTAPERAALAYAALSALEENYQDDVIAAVTAPAGTPPPVLIQALEDATWWASYASRPEIDATAVACVNAMPLHRRQAFLKYLAGVAV